MDLTWLETAGKLSLYFYFLLVSGMLIAILLRTVFRRPEIGSSVETLAREVIDETSRPIIRASRRGLGSRFGRFFLECVGNVNADEPAMTIMERRQNEGSRTLMDQIEEELFKRNVPRGEREQLMEDLRETIRSERRFLEARGRDIRDQEESLATRRRALAERISTLLVKPPAQMVARIRAGLTGTLGSPGIVGDPE